MDSQATMQGVFAPVTTPFGESLQPDVGRLAAHCRWLLDQDCGVVLFGTTSEANSLSLEERLETLEAVLEAGLPPVRVMAGTGCCSLTETARLSARAVELGCGGVLMLPPFYYKEVCDEGLFRYYAEVIERVGDSRLRVYLYHIPPVSKVPLSLALIERLHTAYPQVVAGIKDSGGDWNNTEAILRAFPGWGVFTGTESMLLKNMRAGGVGCISATVNINPGPIQRLWLGWQDPGADAAQEELNAVRLILQKYPLIPALKAVLAHYRGDEAWRQVRPPLVSLDELQSRELVSRLEQTGFNLEG
ncbi:MAG: dihydrodipicolinate synthase family protein [Deltaproteobacteria bacterium]|nr:dihydrodipicolinate synthase family protein [Deltaproteobacteria bacterium]